VGKKIMIEEWQKLAERMTEEQLRWRGISDPRVLSVFKNTPRHLFIPEEYRKWAYADSPQPIGYGQTISQPYIVALMTESLCLKGSERVLEVGTGSGYQAAILSSLAAEIHTIEYIPELAALARATLLEFGAINITVHTGDGSKGLPDFAPFDAILVAAAAPSVPQPLLDQLTPGGRLVIPIGKQGYQKLELWTRKGDGFEEKGILPVSFVPLRGEYGWKLGW
jgi:protein-L-isoaspartate(D-aspartate) O-methyltransferase